MNYNYNRFYQQQALRYHAVGTMPISLKQVLGSTMQERVIRDREIHQKNRQKNKQKMLYSITTISEVKIRCHILMLYHRKGIG
jgi:hypothetical protein